MSLLPSVLSFLLLIVVAFVVAIIDRVADVVVCCYCDGSCYYYFSCFIAIILIVDVAPVDAVVIDTRVLILTFDFLETSMFTVIGVQWFLKLSG